MQICGYAFSFSYSNFTWTRINIPVRYLKNKKPDALHLVFIWLGWKDLNPRNNGVRVRCLTTWRHPNISFCHLLFSDLFIISHFFVFVKSFFQISQKNFFWTSFRLFCVLLMTTYIVYHIPPYLSSVFWKNTRILFFSVSSHYCSEIKTTSRQILQFCLLSS